jgi:hypothetical protein
MPINPLNFQTPQAYSSFDFSPLANLGQQLRQQQEQNNLANLAARYGYSSLDATAPQSQPGGGGPSGGGPSGGGPSGGGPSGGGPSGGGTDYQNAISRIESGGRYDLQGPVTSSGDRAYGKYQIMGENIPQWTRDALGRSMTPAEFLRNPLAQDRVFNHRFGSYVSKYGPGGAARAWFAGEGGMNNPNARDQLGTSVGSYERQFLKGLSNGY